MFGLKIIKKSEYEYLTQKVWIYRDQVRSDEHLIAEYQRMVQELEAKVQEYEHQRETGELIKNPFYLLGKALAAFGDSIVELGENYKKAEEEEEHEKSELQN